MTSERSNLILENILSAVGNTPLVKINKINYSLKPEIYAKVEYLNPGGSTKDRMAIQMLLAAQKEGKLSTKCTIS